MNKQVVLQKWLKTRKSMGKRANGYSLHLSERDRREYIKEYWEAMPECTPGNPPDEYSRPSSEPHVVKVSQEVFDKIKAVKNGLRVFAKVPGPIVFVK